MRAEDDRSQEKLVRRLTTPPFDPDAIVEPKPTSYEKLEEVMGDFLADKDVGRERSEKDLPELWGEK